MFDPPLLAGRIASYSTVIYVEVVVVKSRYGVVIGAKGNSERNP